MWVNNDELVFMNSVTEGPEPFGIVLHMPNQMQVERYKTNVINSMKQKKMIDENLKFTKFGFAILHIWEAYRCCSNHTIINKMNVAVLDHRRIIGIQRKRGGYELVSMDSTVIMYALVKEISYMRKEDVRINNQIEKFTLDEWSRLNKDNTGGVVIIGNYKGKVIQSEEILYEKDQKGYCYDILHQENYEISPRMMRKKIMYHLDLWRESGKWKII